MAPKMVIAFSTNAIAIVENLFSLLNAIGMTKENWENDQFYSIKIVSHLGAPIIFGLTVLMTQFYLYIFYAESKT